MKALRCLFWISWFFWPAYLSCQAPVDSFLQAHPYPSGDSSHILAFYDAVYPWEATAPEQALALYRRGISWSLSRQYLNGAGKGLNYSGIVWFSLGEMDSARQAALASLPYFRQTGNLRGLGASLNNVGNTYNVQSDYAQAIDYYQQANAVFDSLGDIENYLINLNNIGILLVRSGNYESGKTYLEEAIARSREAGFETGLADGYSNLGKMEELQGRHGPSLKYYLASLQAYRRLGIPSFHALALGNVGWSYHALNKPDSALYYIDQALAMLDTLELPRETVNAQANLAQVYFQLGRPETALKVAREGLPIARSLGDRVFEISLIESIIRGYEETGQLDSANFYLHQLHLAMEAQFDLSRNEQLLKLEAQYESEKKDKQILEQELALARNRAEKNRMALGGVILAALFLLGFFWQRHRHRLQQTLARKEAALQEARIRELEQEKQVSTLNGVISGQEEERRRIAQDLHDSLGGLLSTAKMQVSALGHRLGAHSLPPLFQQTQRVIDDACQEVRRIAHNMMPDALLKLGLVAAVEDLAGYLSQAHQLEVRVDNLNWRGRLGPEQEVTLYRITQELLQNIVKHACARQVMIQFSHFDGRLTLAIEDDGQGFDVPQALDSGGLGLKSIQTRASYLGGTAEFDSTPGEGTSVMISLPVP